MGFEAQANITSRIQHIDTQHIMRRKLHVLALNNIDQTNSIMQPEGEAHRRTHIISNYSYKCAKPIAFIVDIHDIKFTTQIVCTVYIHHHMSSTSTWRRSSADKITSFIACISTWRKRNDGKLPQKRFWAVCAYGQIWKCVYLLHTCTHTNKHMPFGVRWSAFVLRAELICSALKRRRRNCGDGRRLLETWK